MKSIMCSVYDNKACTYSPPFIAINKEIAVRMFGQLVNSDGNNVNKYPVDFELIKVGIFDDANGIVEKCDHENYGNALNFVHKGK